MEAILTHLHYYVAIFLMMTGFYMTLSSTHLVRKLLGLGLFQTSVLLFYMASGWKAGGRPPILEATPGLEYVAALPQVLMLTAIVVGVATLAVGLALAVRLYHAYGTLDEEAILAEDNADAK